MDVTSAKILDTALRSVFVVLAAVAAWHLAKLHTKLRANREHLKTTK